MYFSSNNNAKYLNLNDYSNNILNNNVNFNDEITNLPKIEKDEPNFKLHLIRNKQIKDGSLLNFLNSKQKVNQRLQQLSKEKMNMTSNCLGKRMIIKESKNPALDEVLSKTTKNFNLNFN